jgi:hypothetical protein
MPHSSSLPTFPLAPVDANGRTLSVGNAVKVLSVESCVSGLPLEDQKRLRAIVGKMRQVVEFDRSGFVWLCFGTNIELGGDFCVFPKELALE